MDYKLEGKLAFVTGSTKGIGKATAALLHREGAQVILHGRTKESVERRGQGFAHVAQRLRGSRQPRRC